MSVGEVMPSPIRGRAIRQGRGGNLLPWVTVRGYVRATLGNGSETSSLIFRAAPQRERAADGLASRARCGALEPRNAGGAPEVRRGYFWRSARRSPTKGVRLHLDLDIDAGRQVEGGQRVDSLGVRIEDVDDPLMDTHLELLAGVLSMKVERLTVHSSSAVGAAPADHAGAAARRRLDDGPGSLTMSL